MIAYLFLIRVWRNRMKRKGCVFMGKYKRILVAVDGSEEADRAFDQAVELANKYDSVLGIVSVVDIRNFTPSVAFEGDLEEQVYANLKDKVMELSQHAKGKGVKEIRYYLESGNPKTLVAIDIPAEFQADLIIVGATGLNRIEKLLVGSVSSFVTRQAKCDTLIVR